MASEFASSEMTTEIIYSSIALSLANLARVTGVVAQYFVYKQQQLVIVASAALVVYNYSD